MEPRTQRTAVSESKRTTNHSLSRLHLNTKQWSESGGPLTLARFSRCRARLHSISPFVGNLPVVRF